MFDDDGLEVLEPHECLRLLGGMALGRIVYTDRAMPAVQPVTYVMDGLAVLIPAVDGCLVAASARNSVVAFEVDEIGLCHRSGSRSGWSVSGVGQSELVADPEEYARLVVPPLLGGSASDEATHLVRVRLQTLQGLRIPPAEAARTKAS